MEKTILYYPSIEFKPCDYEWLWKASLLWDKIYRIVPDGYQLSEPENIKELCSTGDIGISLSPKQYAAKAANKFNERLGSGRWNAAALEYPDQQTDRFDNYCKLHRDKVDVAIRNLLILNEKSYNPQDEEWFYVSKDLANQYMLFLATEIAKENHLSLYTSDAVSWTASTYFLNDEMIQPAFFPGESYIEESKAALSTVIYQDIFPDNILSIPAAKLLEFRNARKDERTNLLNTIETFHSKLSLASDPVILEEIVHDEQENIQCAIHDYKKSMDLLPVVHWGGYLTTTISLATEALGYTPFDTNILSIAGLSGLAIGILTGLLEKRIPDNHSPYSYLAGITNLRKNSLTDFGALNWDLYRNIEEFIND